MQQIQPGLNEEKSKIINETPEEIQADHKLSKSSEGTHRPPHHHTYASNTDYIIKQPAAILSGNSNLLTP